MPTDYNKFPNNVLPGAGDNAWHFYKPVYFHQGATGAVTPGSIWYVDGENGSSSNDGTSWDQAFDTIQAAVDEAGDGTADIIYCAPHKYQENVLIFEKEALSIIAVVPGWTTRIRPSDATTKYTLTSVSSITIQGIGFVVLSRNVTITGFCIDGGGDYLGVYIGDGYRISSSLYNENVASALIVDNLFIGGGEGQCAILLDGCSSDARIIGNRFEKWTTAAIQIDPGAARTCQQPIIMDNIFIAGATSYGVDMYSSATTVGAQIRNNTFCDGSSATFTYGVRCQGAGVHGIINNKFACTNKISGSSTDFCSGNFPSSAGDSPTFVDED